MRNRTKIKFNLTSEIVTLVILFILLFAGVISYGSKRIFSRIMTRQMETLIEDTCLIAKDCVNGDFFDDYLESEGKSKESLLALRLLQTVCDDTEFNYLYVIRPDFENGKVINSISVHGSMYPELEVYDVGKITEITAEDYRLAYTQIMNGERKMAFVYRLNMPYTYRYKDHVTGLAPISDSNGKIVGIMCAEATFSWYKEAIRTYMINIIVWAIIMVVIVIVVFNLVIRHRIIVPFLKIKKETERFAQFNTIQDKKLTSIVRRNNELGQLADSIDLMESQTLQYVENLTRMTAEKEKNETQLKIATAIQLGALPKPMTLETVELHATMKPALEVGGDFYDFFMIDDRHCGLVIADVSGKGVPAALFMMISKIILGKNLKSGMSPAEALTKTNQELCEENPAEMFVTCLCGVLDLETNVLTFANAGHEKPAILRRGGSFALANTKAGFVLGGMSGIKYKDEVVQLAPGDMMFTYTDGIPEAMSPEDMEFGNDRLIETLDESKDKSLEEICNNMKEAIVKFNDTAPQFDDITMLAFRIKQDR